MTLNELLAVSGGRFYDGYESFASNAVLAAVLIRARGLATLPKHIYRSVDGITAVDVDNPLAPFFSKRGRWNPLVTSVEGNLWMSIRRDIFGDALVRTETNRYGYPVALWPYTGGFTITRSGATVSYGLHGDDDTSAGNYRGGDILHFKSALSKNGGKTGTSLVRAASQTVGLTVDLEKFYSALINNGNHFGGWLTTDKPLSDEDFERLSKQLKERKGTKRAAEGLILDNGLEWTQNTMTMAEADIVKQQEFALQSVGRVFSLPPSALGDLSRQTYSNAEQGDINLVKHGFAPECVMFEAVWQHAIDQLQIAVPIERRSYVQYELDGLLRGDYKTRMEGHQFAINSGLMTIDEVRKLEDLPALGIDRPLVQLGMGFVGEDGEIRGAKTSPKALDPVLTDARNRIAARFASNGDTDGTRNFAHTVLSPIAEAFAACGLPFSVDQTIEEIGREHVRD